METAKSYIDLLSRLRAKFSDDPKHTVRLLGLVFCQPDNKLAREEILPSLARYHYRSGNYQQRSGKSIDFYFAGFDRTTPHESTDAVIYTGIPSKSEWGFYRESFNQFREEIERKTSWEYSGGSDFMLVNCCYNKEGEPHLDFQGAVILTLEEVRQKGLLPDVGIFFETVFKHCEAIKEGDEAWGFGLDAVPGSALIALCKSFFNLGGVDDAGPSHLHVKQISPNESAPQTQGLTKGLFRYDLATRALIITPPGRKHIVDHRYAEVLGQMFKKEAGLYAIRVSHLDFLQVASFFEKGRYRENHPSMTDEQLQEKLKSNIFRIEKGQKKLAQEFRRQFSRWLREKGIDANSVITVDRKNMGYKLGNGWHPKRMVIGDSEAGINYASEYIEEIDEDGSSGMTPRRMGTADEDSDRC